MADTPDHTDELREVAGTGSQGLKSTLDQQVTMLESRDVIGVDVYGVDLSQPLSPAAFATLETAFHTHAVLCLRQQRVTAQQFIDFARRFGEVERIFLTHYAHPQHPEIMLVSNIQENGRHIGHADAGCVWHTDNEFPDDQGGYSRALAGPHPRAGWPSRGYDSPRPELGRALRRHRQTRRGTAQPA